MNQNFQCINLEVHCFASLLNLIYKFNFSNAQKHCKYFYRMVYHNSQKKKKSKIKLKKIASDFFIFQAVIQEKYFIRKIFYQKNIF